LFRWKFSTKWAIRVHDVDPFQLHPWYQEADMVIAPTLPENSTRFLLEHSKSVGELLAEEFGTPFIIYDASNGEPLATNPDLGYDLDLPECFQAESTLGQLTDPHVIQRATGCFEVWIPFREGTRTVLIAATLINGFARTTEESRLEQSRLSKWVNSVRGRVEQAALTRRERKTSANEEQAVLAWESLIMLESLMRRTRFLSDPIDNHRRIIKGLAELLGVDAIIWVPQAIDMEIVLVGDCPLSVWDCRKFATLLTDRQEFERSGMLLENDVSRCTWHRTYPTVSNLLAVQVSDQRMQGCLIAINKREKKANRKEISATVAQDSAESLSISSCMTINSLLMPLVAFRRSDAALMTPFLTLMSTQFRAAHRHQELKDLLVSLTRSLTASIDAKDPYTMGHSERVGRIAAELARELGMKGEELSDVFLAGLLHDIGKIGIKDSVLTKQGPLTPEEFEHIKQHPAIGHQILSDVRAIKHLLPGVLYHHERYDGRGYPHQLVGEAIPFLARILAVADSFDAMHTNRPYREALGNSRVEQIFHEGSGSQWDPRVVEALFRAKQQIYAIQQRGVGESLRHALDHVLKDGSSISRISTPDVPQSAKPQSPQIEEGVSSD